MIIINPIPGQEEENAEFLEKHGVGIWIKKDDKPEEVISKLFSKDEILEKMKENTKFLARKNSTKEICRIILNSCSN